MVARRLNETDFRVDTNVIYTNESGIELYFTNVINGEMFFVHKNSFDFYVWDCPLLEFDYWGAKHLKETYPCLPGEVLLIFHQLIYERKGLVFTQLNENN